ncbi:hypothetical protein BDN70DRAFT_881737 [Pholiota conissans]|uniref:MYND-type domain-containing protein n=1 Tax=Pholiota conissans TaxID=109636 RepID=A0A9P5YWA2_9AGAR|nr:hypothetical protein BDN70DRAFT_881737 [Pholiota conissans]
MYVQKTPNSKSKNPLSNFFSDTETSPYCARCILGAASTGTQSSVNANGLNEFWLNLTRNLGLWTSQMHFMFSVRTEEQTCQLLERMNRCSCPMRDPRIREYHRLGRTMEDYILAWTCVETSPAVAFISSLFLVLTTALEGARVKTVAKRTSSERWPTCPEDLMPFGPKNLVDSFITWSHFIPDFLIFRVASQCVEFCGALLAPYATQPELTRCAIDAGRQLFDRTWATVHLRSGGVSRRIMGKAFIQQIESFIYYFGFFFNDQPIDKKMLMIEGYEVKAVQICSLLAYVAGDVHLLVGSPDTCTAALAAIGSQIYACMGQCFEPLPSVLVHPAIFNRSRAVWAEWEAQQVELQTGESCRSVAAHDRVLACIPGPNAPDGDVLYPEIARMAINHIRNGRFDLYCSAQDCPNSMQSSGKAYQRCGACNVAGYCSKKCQKASWNSPQYPHKSLCKILQNLVAIASFDLIFSHPPSQNLFAMPKRELTFLGPPPSYSLDDIVNLVIEKWKQAYVTTPDLFYIAGWASHRTCSADLPTKTECEPGYEDYDTKIAELTQRTKTLKPEYLIPEDTTYLAQGYKLVRSMFDATSNGAVVVRSGDFISIPAQ